MRSTPWCCEHPALATDNAAMIAAAFPKLERGEFADLSLAAQANLPLS